MKEHICVWVNVGKYITQFNMHLHSHIPCISTHMYFATSVDCWCPKHKIDGYQKLDNETLPNRKNGRGKPLNEYMVLNIFSDREFSFKPVSFPSHWNSVVVAWSQQTVNFSDSFNEVTHLWPWKTLPRKILVSQRFPAGRVKCNVVPVRQDSVTPCSLGLLVPTSVWNPGSGLRATPGPQLWGQPAPPQGAWCGHSRHRASLSADTSLRIFLTSSKTSSLFLKRTKWILFGTPFL